MMKKIMACLIAVTMIGFSLDTATAARKSGNANKRIAIDDMAKKTLKELYETRSKSKKFFDSAYGYAVFNNLKISLMISAGGDKAWR